MQSENEREIGEGEMSQHGMGVPTRLWESLKICTPDRTSAAPPKLSAPTIANRRQQDRVALLIKLAARVQSFGPGPGPDDPGDIPAGYTYLGQLVAHDLTKIADPSFVAPDKPREISRSRPYPLRLETLYGDGPAGSPMLYEIAQTGAGNVLARSGRLRLGLTNEPAYEAADIPRLGCPLAPVRQNSGAKQPTAAGWACPADALDHSVNPRSGSAATEPLLADPRNDDTLLMSQMLTVFIRLHNRLYDKIAVGGGTDIVAAFRRARSATIAIYQHILAEDLFPRLLDQRIFRFYQKEPARPGIPVEFKHGAYRICHSMVRTQYHLVQRPRPDSVAEFLQRESSRGSKSLPLKSRWVVDWSAFFDDTASENKQNLSRRLGPSINPTLAYHRPFEDDRNIGAGATLGGLSLVLHDYLRADELIRQRITTIRKSVPNALFPSTALFFHLPSAYGKISDWLGDPSFNKGAPGIDPLSAADIRQLSRNAPLPFLIAFEAMNDCDGKRFGPLGSAIVARTVAPLLADQDKEALADAQALLEMPSEAIGHMGALIRFLDPDASAT